MHQPEHNVKEGTKAFFSSLSSGQQLAQQIHALLLQNSGFTFFYLSAAAAFQSAGFCPTSKGSRLALASISAELAVATHVKRYMANVYPAQKEQYHQA